MPILTIHPIHQLKVLNVVDLKSYYEKNKETIDKYNQFKRDIDKQRHIENPKFRKNCSLFPLLSIYKI